MAQIIPFPKKKKRLLKRSPIKIKILNDTKDCYPMIRYYRMKILNELAQQIKMIWKRKQQNKQENKNTRLKNILDF